MLYLIISVAFAVLIANILKYASIKKTNILVIFWGNYLFAAVFSYYLTYNEGLSTEYSEIFPGVITGILFLVNFFLYGHNINVNGMSMAVSVMRISVILPVIFSIIFFKESLGIFKASGIVLILLSFYLSGKKDYVKSLFWLLMLFICTGFTDTCLKYYEYNFGGASNSFLFYTFLFSFIINSLILIIKKVKIDFKSLLFGIALGIPNQLTSLYFLKALELNKAVLVYPFFASNVVIFSVFSDSFFWKIKFSTRQKIYFVIMILGIVLINLNK